MMCLKVCFARIRIPALSPKVRHPPYELVFLKLHFSVAVRCVAALRTCTPAAFIGMNTIVRLPNLARSSMFSVSGAEKLNYTHYHIHFDLKLVTRSNGKGWDEIEIKSNSSSAAYKQFSHKFCQRSVFDSAYQPM